MQKKLFPILKSFLIIQRPNEKASHKLFFVLYPDLLKVYENDDENGPAVEKYSLKNIKEVCRIQEKGLGDYSTKFSFLFSNQKFILSASDATLSEKWIHALYIHSSSRPDSSKHEPRTPSQTSHSKIASSSGTSLSKSITKSESASSSSHSVVDLFPHEEMKKNRSLPVNRKDFGMLPASEVTEAVIERLFTRKGWLKFIQNNQTNSVRSWFEIHDRSLQYFELKSNESNSEVEPRKLGELDLSKVLSIGPASQFIIQNNFYAIELIGKRQTWILYDESNDIEGKRNMKLWFLSLVMNIGEEDLYFVPRKKGSLLKQSDPFEFFKPFHCVLGWRRFLCFRSVEDFVNKKKYIFDGKDALSASSLHYLTLNDNSTFSLSSNGLYSAVDASKTFVFSFKSSEDANSWIDAFKIEAKTGFVPSLSKILSVPINEMPYYKGRLNRGSMVVHSGLLREGNGKKELYFELMGDGILKSYNSIDPSGLCHGAIDISRAAVGPPAFLPFDEDNNVKNLFSFDVSCPDKIHTFYASDYRTLIPWLRAIIETLEIKNQRLIPICEGQLRKKGSYLGMWKSRYCCLTQNFLVYFVTKWDAEKFKRMFGDPFVFSKGHAKGIIHFQDQITFRRLPRILHYDYIFSLTIGDREYTFGPDTEQSFELWSSNINKVLLDRRNA